MKGYAMQQHRSGISDAEIDLLASSIVEDFGYISNASSDNDTSIKNSCFSVENEQIEERYCTITMNRYYVLLTGVPFNATHDDIISFFKPIPVTEIFFVTNYQRKPIGNVFVVFDNKSNYKLAFERNGNYIYNRYVKILSGNINEFKKSIRIFHGINMKRIINKNDNNSKIIIKLKGFSFEVEKSEIYKWLLSKSVLPQDIYIIYDHRNRNSGIVFVVFKKKKDRNGNAVFKLNNEYLGNRYINVFRSSLNELKLSLAEMCGASIDQLNFNPYLNCLRIQNIPNNCKDKDIISFFEDTIFICPKQLYIRKNIAYVQFHSAFDCKMALTRHQTYLNNSLIRLIQISKYELRDAMEGKNALLNNNSKNEISSDCNFSAEFENYNNHTEINKENIPKFNKTKHIVSIRGIPFNSRRQAIVNFFKGYISMDSKSVRFYMDHKGRFSGKCTVVFYDRNEARQAVNELDRKYIGNRYVLLTLI